MTFEFKPFPKTPRLHGAEMIITEKIDGTNSCIIIGTDGSVGAQSRNRVITPENDNYGFAQWVADNSITLAEDLGPGYHYGEWWGSGIQRGYGLGKGKRRFSLFNTTRWDDSDFITPDLEAVPVLEVSDFRTSRIPLVVSALADQGSVAAPGFDRPEGVVVFIPRINQSFKVLIENDDIPKGLVA